MEVRDVAATVGVTGMRSPTAWWGWKIWRIWRAWRPGAPTLRRYATLARFSGSPRSRALPSRPVGVAGP